MSARDEVKVAVQRLYDRFGEELQGLEPSSLVDDVIAEKDLTIQELRGALHARTQVKQQIDSINGGLKRSLPVRMLRKTGAIKLVKRTLRAISPR